MSDKSVMSARQAAELDHALGRNGWTSEDVKNLSGGTILAQLLPIIKGEAEFRCIVNLDVDPYVPEGWIISEHQKGGQVIWPQRVDLYSSSRQSCQCAGGDSGDSGRNIHEAIQKRKPFNAVLLDFLLKYPILIPADWKDKIVLFWGTIYADEHFPSESSRIRGLVLRPENNQWGWSWNSVGGTFYRRHCAVISW